MNVSILTLFPDLYTPFLSASLIKRAQDTGALNCQAVNLFSFCQPKERVDGPVFGHGDGMVLRPEVVERAVVAREKEHGAAFKIFFSPHGKKLTQDLLRDVVKRIGDGRHIMLLPARYEGMDVRIEEEYADEIVSIGDFVLMGGDLPAMIFLEGFLRLLPGIVGKQGSVEEESFEGPFVDYPSYTAPVEWKGHKVPEVLRSGDHGKIIAWREQQMLERTVFGHFDWVRTHATSLKQNDALLQTILPHYVALLHVDVMLPGERVGTTSVTSLDIHDIARSAATYGIQGYFIVTPLRDQQNMAHTLLDFWSSDVGIAYNAHRHTALQLVHILDSLAQVQQAIEEKHGKPPLIVATSAHSAYPEKMISYYDQAKVWKERRPVLLVLGTGRGLAPVIFDTADFVLAPLEGYSTFNHLSVRSAAAVIFDRWLGINQSKVSGT